MYLDLDSVIPGDPELAEANAQAICQAIATWSGPGVELRLPEGDVYVGQAGDNYSVLFGPGVAGVTLSGRGRALTRLIQHGPGDGGEWHAVLFDRCVGCGLRDLELRQGIIGAPDNIQLNHLVNVTNQSSDGTGECLDTEIQSVTFGKCIGDQLRIFGNTAPVSRTRAWDLELDGAGICIQDWAPSTNYPLNSWVRADGGKNYRCVSPGLSGLSGPSGTSTGIADGQALWDHRPRREAARTCISIQRGYDDARIWDFSAVGAQNGIIDCEPTSAGGEFAGREVMRHLHIFSGFVDNRQSTTSTAVTFSGITAGTKSYGNRMSDVDIVGGSLNMIQTSSQVISQVTVSCRTAFLQDASTPNVVIRQSNDDLSLIDLNLDRGDLCEPGHLLDVQGASRLSLSGGSLHQSTAAQLIVCDASSARFVGASAQYDGPSPASTDAIYVSAITGDSSCLALRIAVTSTAKLRSAVQLVTRFGFKMGAVTVREVACPALHCVRASFEAGTQYSAPTIVDCSGHDVLWVAEDASDNPLPLSPVTALSSRPRAVHRGVGVRAGLG